MQTAAIEARCRGKKWKATATKTTATERRSKRLELDAGAQSCHASKSLMKGVYSEKAW
jgi:hypothetical protein